MGHPAAFTREGNQTGARYGSAVATAGDVNGDGYADVIVGALLFDNGQTDEGGAFVYHGSPRPRADPAWTAEGDQAGAAFGDFGRDGGRRQRRRLRGRDRRRAALRQRRRRRGPAFVYLGSAAGLATAPAWTAESDQAAAIFGRSVAAAGDVNGDGFADVIVGAPCFDSGQPTRASGLRLPGLGPAAPD